MTYRIAVLVSGSGSNLQSLLDAQSASELGAEVVLVVTDRANAYGLQRALDHRVAALYLPLLTGRKKNGNAQVDARAVWECRLADVITAFAPDLIILSGFMRVLSSSFLERFPNQIVNQHPALLPEHGGDMVRTSSGLEIPVLRGAHVVAEALQRGLPLTGCTVHRVTPVVDDGPVLARAEVPVLPDDDEASLHERIKIEERRLIVQVVRDLARADS
ncbi:MAG: phosphoribosylglycinamide formyltransferase [Chloroflexales bacterium]|nr:phosphoribosylglycinamide formyltransferase [Chloroflexales bacterium]